MIPKRVFPFGTAAALLAAAFLATGGVTAAATVGLNGSTQHLMKSRQGCLQEGGVIEARKVQTPTEAAHGRPDGGVVDATGRRRAGDANRSPLGPLREVGQKLHP